MYVSGVESERITAVLPLRLFIGQLNFQVFLYFPMFASVQQVLKNSTALSYPGNCL